MGIAGGALAAILLAPKKHRGKIMVGLAIALAGGIYLTDPGFFRRASTITTKEEEMDSSARSRVEIWEASVDLLCDHPLLGVGAGNFFQTIGRYNPKHKGRDAHNTYVRCYSELGIPGIVVFLAVATSSILIVRRAHARADNLDPEQQDRILYYSYMMVVSLITLFGCALTMTLLYNEFLWWILAIPICLERALQNLQPRGVRLATLRHP